MISKTLLNILLCPSCNDGDLIEVSETKLICSNCKKEYQVKDGIPILLVE